MSGASKSKLLWKTAEDEDHNGSWRRDRGVLTRRYGISTSQSRGPIGVVALVGTDWDKAICSCRGTNMIYGP
jgi:hypothetical protein